MKAKNEKVFLSGKISGMIPEAEVLFKQAEQILKDKGYWKIINPMTYQFSQKYRNYLKKNKEYKTGGYEMFMKKAIRDLICSDILVALPNWANSEGALLENHIARTLKMPILFINLETGELKEYDYDKD